jgi:hypothetical protein
MAEPRNRKKVNIRPRASVYATYRRLSYRAWFAIAEFVDNSTQSYYNHKKELRKAYKSEGDPGKLVVTISYDAVDRILKVVDNANGMDFEELTRAITLDRPPPDPSGRCEYGMGLKTAACWFGETWSIRTSRFGSGIEYRATIHVPSLVNGAEEIAVDQKKVDVSSHFTCITIEGLYKPIQGRTSGRIRDQLGSMYRQDLRSGDVEIVWSGEPVKYEEPPILVEHLPGGAVNNWMKAVDFNVPWIAEDRELRVKGWIGLRIPGSQRDAGFVLLRRGRVVVGGPGEGYKPEEIFGQGNTFRSQRLIGELNLDHWPVSQAKDAFDWSGGLEDAFIEKLKGVSRGYMEKAEGHRQARQPVTKAEMEMASESTRRALEDARFGTAIEHQVKLDIPPKTPEQEEKDVERLRAVSHGPVIYRVPYGDQEWLFRLHWQEQLSDAHWMSVDYPSEDVVDVFLNTGHPFFTPHMGSNTYLDIVQKFVVSLALAERMARLSSENGLIAPEDFRNFMNIVLRLAMELEAENG